MSAAAAPINISAFKDAPTIHAQEFDSGSYGAFPQTDGAETVALMRELGRVAPDDLTGDAKAALERMLSDRAALEAAMAGELATKDDSDVRPTLYELNALWRVANARLKPVAEMRSDLPEREDAREVISVLFSDGVEFTNRTSSVLLVESQVRLSLLDDEKLHGQFERAAGGWLEAAIRVAHANHAAYVDQITPPAPPVNVPDVSLAITEGRLSTLAYVRWILAQTSERQPASVVRAAHALSPIDKLREQKRRSPAKSATAEVEAPKPQTPSAAPVAPAANGANGPAPVAAAAATAPSATAAAKPSEAATAKPTDAAPAKAPD